MQELYMLWFSNLDGISLNTKFLLLNYFSSAKNIFMCEKNDLINCNILSFKQIDTLISNRNLEKTNKLYSTLIENDVKFVDIFNDSYPCLLKTIYTPPLVLYYRGTLPKNDVPLVSIVGTRRCTNYGKLVTKNLTKDLVSKNIGIVSGLADGIDSVAHREALSNNGYTIAVLGTNILECYPKSNVSLMTEIIKTGAVISEYPPNTKTYPKDFPKRNRIIVGLSKAIVITEAPLKSGAIISANIALEEGREVLAVPSSILEPKGFGTNELIKDGAYPVTSYIDILNAINITESVSDKKEIDKSEVMPLNEEEAFLYSFFTNVEISTDELLYKSNLDIVKLQILLTMLEFKKVIKKLPGQKYIKIN